MFYILVLEDHYIQRKSMVNIIKDLGDNYCVLAADTIEKAFNISKDYKIDLFILDIELPDGSGLEFAQEIRKEKDYEFTWMVFLTSYEQYVLEAVRKVHCYDYIVKPYCKHEVQKLVKRLLTTECGIQKKNKEYLAFDTDGIIVRIFIEDIFFIEAYRKDLLIHTLAGQYKIKRTSLKKICRKVEKLGFLQCHRSYIINKKFVKRIDTNKNTWEIYFEGYNELALVGITYREKIKSTILYGL